MGTKMKKVKKKRLNIARTLVFILFVYIIATLNFYVGSDINRMKAATDKMGEIFNI